MSKEKKVISSDKFKEVLPEGEKIQSILVSHLELGNLVGELMQYIEATYQDTEQRKAHKGIVKNVCRTWLNDMYEGQIGWKIKYETENGYIGDNYIVKPLKQLA